MHLGAFCIENAPTLSVVTVVTVLVATGLCPVATGSRPFTIGSVRVATSSYRVAIGIGLSCNWFVSSCNLVGLSCNRFVASCNVFAPSCNWC